MANVAPAAAAPAALSHAVHDSLIWQIALNGKKISWLKIEGFLSLY